MVKLIVLFFIFGACGLLNARSSHENNWNSDKVMREIKPPKIKVSGPRKVSKETKELDFLESSDEDRLGNDSIDKESSEEKRFKKDKVFRNKEDEEDSEDGTDDISDSDDDDMSNRNLRIATSKLNENCGNPFVKPNLRQTKIIGGKEAVPHSWPWQIQIRLWSGYSYQHVCGGTILTTSTILTAAHCFFDLNSHELVDKSYFQIVAGEYNIGSTKDSPTQKSNIKELIVHSDYDPDNDNNDIAIIILSQKLQFNNNISAACLPNGHIGDNASCYSTGWGVKNTTTQETSNVLLQVYLPTISAGVCKRVLKENYREYAMCAGYLNGTKDTCLGDSGGPFVCRNTNNAWVVHGIVSWGKGCAEVDFPGVYTRVYSFLNWIKQKSID